MSGAGLPGLANSPGEMFEIDYSEVSVGGRDPTRLKEKSPVGMTWVVQGLRRPYGKFHSTGSTSFPP